MDGMWWERPYTVAGVDIGAGSAKLHLVTSYGARQDIELHTDDDTMVDKFVVNTQTPADPELGRCRRRAVEVRRTLLLPCLQNRQWPL